MARRRRSRLPDEVRAAAVRAGLAFAFTVVTVIVAVLASWSHTALIVPALAMMAMGVFVLVWCLIDVVVSRQVAASRRRAPNSLGPLDGSRERTRRRGSASPYGGQPQRS
ncbi:hypothetical protein [Kitasatospora cheerisanensis]|uniref:Uncharacterized protein n=1 Tax=Kitasatospora cheerisanensis KCTC 2395 TaxID=1348663 RepID=A0A066YZJ8_9ACTN|nr:hypothetical protein [Kitasatospora cheerisanensis]KDN86642.1 hypothetical protein KCH_16050 [Kitasatospora cheerisanensis KCTC 2395]